jgi:uncharacterized protein (TIGR02001 family)
MSQRNYKSLRLGLLAGSCLMVMTSASMAAEIEGNAAVSSNYMWRGMTQTDDAAAVSGGFDLTTESGFYAGTWASNIDFGDAASYELDLYAGFSGEAESGVSYDIGYIAYLYPDAGTADYDFGEVYASIGYGPFSVTYSFQVDESADSYANDSNYLSVDYEVPITEEFTASLHYGYYDIEASPEQTDYSLTLAKGDFSLSFIGTEDVTTDDDTKVVLAYGFSF